MLEKWKISEFFRFTRLRICRFRFTSKQILERDNSRGITMGNSKITHDSVTKYFKVSYTLKFVKEQWVQKQDFAVIFGFDGHSQLNVGNHPYPILFCSEC